MFYRRISHYCKPDKSKGDRGGEYVQRVTRFIVFTVCSVNMYSVQIGLHVNQNKNFGEIKYHLISFECFYSEGRNEQKFNNYTSKVAAEWVVLQFRTKKVRNLYTNRQTVQPERWFFFFGYFFSICPAKCRCSAFSQALTVSFYMFSKLLFIYRMNRRYLAGGH